MGAKALGFSSIGATCAGAGLGAGFSGSEGGGEGSSCATFRSSFAAVLVEGTIFAGSSNSGF
jgi:hypothetical protein